MLLERDCSDSLLSLLPPSIELDEPPRIPKPIEDILCHPSRRSINRQPIGNDLPFPTYPLSGRIEVPHFLAHPHFEDVILRIPLFHSSSDV